MAKTVIESYEKAGLTKDEAKQLDSLMMKLYDAELWATQHCKETKSNNAHFVFDRIFQALINARHEIANTIKYDM